MASFSQLTLLRPPPRHATRHCGAHRRCSGQLDALCGSRRRPHCCGTPGAAAVALSSHHATGRAAAGAYGRLWLPHGMLASPAGGLARHGPFNGWPGKAAAPPRSGCLSGRRAATPRRGCPPAAGRRTPDCHCHDCPGERASGRPPLLCMFLQDSQMSGKHLHSFTDCVSQALKQTCARRISMLQPPVPRSLRCPLPFLRMSWRCTWRLQPPDGASRLMRCRHC